MKIKTSRFGELQVNKTDIIQFPDGMLGFESLRRFFVIDPGDSTLILWLQSADDENVAFPIIEPKIFSPDYVVKLMPSELASLALENVNQARIFSILTIPQNVVEMTANLKAPIVINNQEKLGKQVVLQDSKLSVKFEMYKELKKYIVNYASDDSKKSNVSTAQVNSIQNNSGEKSSQQGLNREIN